MVIRVGIPEKWISPLMKQDMITDETRTNWHRIVQNQGGMIVGIEWDIYKQIVLQYGRHLFG